MKESKTVYSRRKFLKQNALIGAGTLFTVGTASNALAFPGFTGATSSPAVLGGDPVRTAPWPKWPIWNPETDEKIVLEAIRSGIWSRAGLVTKFEATWAETVGARYCMTTVNGTNALIASLIQLGVGAGDEVIIPPYTFIATPAAVLAAGAIPVFVDVDRETFQMNPDKIEEKITSRTKAILPVHICGFPSDMVSIMKIAKKHNLAVVEDACQAWTAEIDNKQVGTFGDAGCYSFQNSKNIPIGEGGAIVSDDREFMDRCFSYHNFGLPYGHMKEEYGSGFVIPGTKLRMTEYQAAIGLAQLERFEEQTLTRIANAEYLKEQISQIPGIIPYKLYDNVTRAAFHLFPFRYQKSQFQDVPKEEFVKALRAEGIPCSGGYTPLNKMPFLENALKSDNFKKTFPKELLDYDRYLERNQCPENDLLCDEEAVWFTQSMLLGDRSDMDDIVKAIEKIHQNIGKIKSAV